MAAACPDPALVRAAVARLPRMALGRFPTPLRELRPGLWLKDDGACADGYAGNKVRKWEMLAAAPARGRLVLWGDAASHTLLSAAILGRRAGLEIDLVAYAGQPRAAEVLRATGAALTWAPGFAAAWLQAHWLAWRRGGRVLPLGATTPLSTVGWVAGGLELADQVRAGLMPQPLAIHLALGSGGSAAGLALGVAAAGLPTEVIAVRAVPALISPRRSIDRLIRRTATLLGLDPLLAQTACARLVIDNGQLGGGYRVRTAAADAAVATARACGMELETDFTGKAFAACLASSASPRLFWNTHAAQAGD